LFETSGSGTFQSRLDTGGLKMYGNPVENGGVSSAEGKFSSGASLSVSVDSIVQVNSGTDSLGKASPFTEDSLFCTLKLVKVG